MSAQLKYSVKESTTSGAAKSAFCSIIGKKTQGDTSSALFVGMTKVLKAYIADYGDPGHLELYHKSKGVLLDYIRVEYDKGDMVAESILGGAATYPLKPLDPAT